MTTSLGSSSEPLMSSPRRRRRRRRRRVASKFRDSEPFSELFPESSSSSDSSSEELSSVSSLRRRRRPPRRRRRRFWPSSSEVESSDSEVVSSSTESAVFSSDFSFFSFRPCPSQARPRLPPRSSRRSPQRDCQPRTDEWRDDDASSARRPLPRRSRQPRSRGCHWPSAPRRP